MLEMGRRFLFRLFLLVMATLPFELPVAEGLHGRLKPLIGDAYMLFFCGTWLALVSLLYLYWQKPRLGDRGRQFSVYAIVFAMPGLMAIVVSAVVPSGEVQLSAQQFIFGYAAPLLCCLTVFSMTEREQRTTWLAFYVGWCLFLAGSLMFLAISWQTAIIDSSFAQMGFGQKLIFWRYTFGEPWNLYSLYLGNANKESNYILIFLLFSSVLIGREEIQKRGIARRVYFTFWTLGVFTLLVLFSRAALLLLPVAIVASGLWKVLGRKMRWAISTATAATLALGYAALGPALVYLFTARTSDDMASNALGTFTFRFEQWDQLREFLLQHNGALFFGLGTGGYGLRFFGSVENGTHNMFLDTLVESGVLGFMALVLFMTGLLLHSLGYFRGRHIHGLALIGILCLLALMFREHSVSYLYVTSLGGMCFASLLYVLTRSPGAAHTTPHAYKAQ